jgi:hypothetical protein
MYYFYELSTSIPVFNSFRNLGAIIFVVHEIAVLSIPNVLVESMPGPRSANRGFGALTSLALVLHDKTIKYAQITTFLV